jgi:hypothetical protein
MSICDFLFSADLCVQAVTPAIEELVARLGIPQPGPAAYTQYEDEGWDTIFALVNKSFSAAPTRLEIIAPLDPPGARPARAGRRIHEAQDPRLWRTHATVVATPDMTNLVEKVRKSGARHWLQPPAEDVTFERLWMGIGPHEAADYDAAADGGFRFEFIPSDSPAFPPKAFTRPLDEAKPGEVGMRRIRYRAFLVADLDASLRRLEAVFGWEPAHPVRSEPRHGLRFATMSANQPHGAHLRLIEAMDPDTAVGADYAAQGPGPYTITLSAFDLEASAADLSLRQTAFKRVEPGLYTPGALVPILSPGLGAQFAIIDDGMN